METMTIVGEARAALETTAFRTADLLSSLPSAIVPIPGSEWTVRDAAVHLAHYSALYAEIANGMRSPIEGPTDPKGRSLHDGMRYRDALALNSARRLADVPETDPERLASLVRDGARRLVDTTIGRSDEQPVSFHCGLPFTLAGVLCAALAEQIIHGHDIAGAVGRPSTIDPVHAALAVGGTAPLLALCVNPESAADLNVSYQIEVRDAGRSVVRFVDGACSLEAADSATVDCIISAHPVAQLLVGAGRLRQSSAIALGLIAAGGPRPELAVRFPDLFISP